VQLVLDAACRGRSSATTSPVEDPDYLDVAAKHDVTVSRTHPVAPPRPDRSITTTTADVTVMLLDRARR
jgi:hypothetical protein